MNESEGKNLKSLLNDIANNQCNALCEILEEVVEAMKEVQDAYRSKLDKTDSYHKIQNCLKQFKKVTNQLRNHV